MTENLNKTEKMEIDNTTPVKSKRKGYHRNYSKKEELNQETQNSVTGESKSTKVSK